MKPPTSGVGKRFCDVAFFLHHTLIHREKPGNNNNNTLYQLSYYKQTINNHQNNTVDNSWLVDLLKYLESKSNCIDWNDFFSGVVLECSSKESLRKEKSGNPKNDWNSVVDPMVNEFHSCQ